MCFNIYCKSGDLKKSFNNCAAIPQINANAARISRWSTALNVARLIAVKISESIFYSPYPSSSCQYTERSIDENTKKVQTICHLALTDIFFKCWWLTSENDRKCLALCFAELLGRYITPSRLLNMSHCICPSPLSFCLISPLPPPPFQTAGLSTVMMTPLHYGGQLPKQEHALQAQCPTHRSLSLKCGEQAASLG